jgi:hypothetical protein
MEDFMRGFLLLDALDSDELLLLLVLLLLVELGARDEVDDDERVGGRFIRRDSDSSRKIFAWLDAWGRPLSP